MLPGFGKRLAETREEKGFSQTKLARQVDVSKASISAYERDANMPSAEILYRICIHLNESSDYLLGIKEQKRISVDGLTSTQINIVQAIIEAFKSKNG